MQSYDQLEGAEPSALSAYLESLNEPPITEEMT
jgi:hypothetical protein